jgi:hypothetical protein
MSPEFRWEFGSRRSLGGRLLNPLDLVRRRLTKGLEVDAGQPEVRRGAEVEVLATITSARGLGDLEVGLLCTEYYDEEDTDHEGHASRSTSEAIAHEAWQPLEPLVGVQTARFGVPQEAPFSYEGDCLSFKWEIVARGRRRGRLDAQARREISVRP